MANNNEFADLENYRKCLLATHFYKCGISGNPTDRFFGYIGPNGTTLAKVGSESTFTPLKPSNILVEGSFVHPVGLLAKQALSRDLANGDIKYGQDGVTFYTFYTVNTTAGTSVTFTEPGTVVGVFAKSTAACAGDEVPTFSITAPTAGATAVAAIAGSQVVPQFTSGASAANNVKELTLTTTWANRTFLAGATTTVSTTVGAGGTTDAVTYVVAVAHHSA